MSSAMATCRLPKNKMPSTTANKRFMITSLFLMTAETVGNLPQSSLDVEGDQFSLRIRNLEFPQNKGF